MTDLIAPLQPENPKDLSLYLVTEEDMRICPLCRKDWISVEQDDKIYLTCLPCMISIHVQDPCLGRWTRIEKESCPICRYEDTRVFFRQDGYLKYYCPKCKLIIENVDEKKHDKLIRHEVQQGTRWLPKKDIERIDRENE